MIVTIGTNYSFLNTKPERKILSNKRTPINEAAKELLQNVALSTQAVYNGAFREKNGFVFHMLEQYFFNLFFSLL